MSNALAIASVTAVLKDLLNDGLINANIDAVGQFSVTSLPPDQLIQQGVDQTNRLNIYMWNATRNAALSNERYPSHNSAGDRINNPILALDLHYILTATGEEELSSEILLGYGMQLLHETPVLSRSAIRQLLDSLPTPVDTSLLPAIMRFLSASDLADQFEQIKITSEVVDPDNRSKIESLSNLWSSFSTPLRASALYHVSCVLIESDTPVRTPFPVLTLGGRTAPIRAPRITRVATSIANNPTGIPDATVAILPGSWIIIEGASLSSDMMKVIVANKEIPFERQHVTNSRISVQLPDDIQAGLSNITIEHLFQPDADNVSDIRLWEMSNSLPLVVVPTVIVPIVPPNPDELVISLSHSVGLEQTCRIIFNPLPGRSEKALTVQAIPQIDNKVKATIPEGVSGEYLVRVEINGAQSLLSISQGAAGFDKPVVTLP